jgi:hypothetical protein
MTENHPVLPPADVASLLAAMAAEVEAEVGALPDSLARWHPAPNGPPGKQPEVRRRMIPNPKYLGPEYAAMFQDSSVVESNRQRTCSYFV